MYLHPRYLADQRARYESALRHLPPHQRAIAVEGSLLQEVLNAARPETEDEYEFWYRGFCWPEGAEFDRLLTEAAAEVKATRPEGAPDIHPEHYIMRVPERQKADDDEPEQGGRDSEPSSAEDTAARRAEKTEYMRKLRAARDLEGMKDSR